MKENLINFIKKETVLVIAACLALMSAFFVTPGKAYLGYIDWRVLGILLSLMTIMAGLQKNGLFDSIGSLLLSKTKNTVQLSTVLIFLCFFFSMFITNDVALLTFVPFTILILKKCDKESLLIPIILFQTIAANLGSMLTPIGNPQNLYLYNLADMGVWEFMQVMLPYTLASGILLLAAISVLARRKETIQVEITHQKVWNTKITLYVVLFLLSLLVVARILPFYIVLPLVLITTLILDRDVLKNVDYCLLLTFISFFIFTGNMGNIPKIQQFLQNLVEGRELFIGIFASQFISNVPAALLLSGFTSDLKALLVGVNLGGLGTLIASMASLISYKLYAHQYNETKGKYFLWFTVANVLFLIVLVALYVVI